MSKRKKSRGSSQCSSAPGISPNYDYLAEPVTNGQLQSIARQTTGSECEVLIREITERLTTLTNKLNNLRYS